MKSQRTIDARLLFFIVSSLTICHMLTILLNARTEATLRDRLAEAQRELAELKAEQSRSSSSHD